MRKLLIALLLHTSGANAGWFGPSDYRECVLAEMNGKPPYMLSTVRGLCNNRFPCPQPTPSEYAVCDDMSDNQPYQVPTPGYISPYLPTAREKRDPSGQVCWESPHEAWLIG
jgi:hypothetical protein